MSPLAERLLCVLVGIIGTLLMVVAVYFLVMRRKPEPVGAGPAVIDQKALADAAQALLDRAKAEAQSEEALKQVAEIEKIQDPAEKLKALSDALKSV